MPGKGCPRKRRRKNPKKGNPRKHTPIVSEKQRGLFGAEYRRGKEGKRKRTGMSQAELKHHLKEAGGKKLPQRSKGRLRKKRRKSS